QPLAAYLQYPSHLSARWRPDSALLALVCSGACPQPPGGYGSRIYRGCGIHHFGSLRSLDLVRSDCRLHGPKLLGRTAARVGSFETSQIATPRWVCLPELQSCTAHWGELALWQLQAAI